MAQEKGLIVFQDRKIRRTWFNDEWWFSIVNIIAALVDNDRARKYWSDLKVKLTEESFEVSEKIGQLKLIAKLSNLFNPKNSYKPFRFTPILSK